MKREMDYLVIIELYLRGKCYDNRMKSFFAKEEALEYADQMTGHYKEEIEKGMLGDFVINVYKRIG